MFHWIRESLCGRIADGRGLMAVLLLLTGTGRLVAQSALDQTQLPPPPAPAGVSQPESPIPSSVVTNIARPNSRVTPLWSDKPLKQLKASIARHEPDGEKLSDAELARLNQATALMATGGSWVSFPGDSRPWMLTSFEWEAPATRHLPLLFEEPNLERMGYTFRGTDYLAGNGSVYAGDGLQPFFSAAHFFGRLPLLPYMCGINPVCEPVYALGVDRPGSPVPFRRRYLPLSLKGALYEAGAVVGMFYCIP